MLGPGIKGVDLHCNVSTGVSKCLQRWYSTKFRLGCLWPELKHFDGGDVMLNSRYLNIKKKEGKESGRRKYKESKESAKYKSEVIFLDNRGYYSSWEREEMNEEGTQNAKVLLVNIATANAGGLPTEFRFRHCDLNTPKQRNYYTIFLLNALIL